jgi:hypothetical protein
MPLTDDEAAAEVARMRARHERRAYHRPQTDRYRDDLVKLRTMGADFRDLSDWLARQSVPVAASPLKVARWFDREYPELGRKKERKTNADVQPSEASGGSHPATAAPRPAEAT